MKPTRSFTIHDVEPELYTAILSQAQEQDTSLNRMTKALLRKATGLTVQKKKRDLSWLGRHQWTKNESEDFDRANRDAETIHPGDW